MAGTPAVTTRLAATLIDRVRAATTGCSEWPGRTGSEALAHALALDIETAGATAEQVAAVTDDQLKDGTRQLHRALHGDGASFRLPFGTAVTIGRPGSVEIAGRVFVRRPHSSGLHHIEATPTDVGGQTFESFRLYVLNWASSSNASHLGLPSPATIADGRVRQVIEFPPLAEAGGAVLQYDADMVDAARFCAAPARSLERFCKVVIKDLQWLWRWRAKVARRVEEVRAAAVAGIALADHYGRRAVVGRICVDGRSLARPEGLTLRVEYLGLDDSLRRGRLFETVAGHDVVDGATMMRGPLINRWRTGVAARLHDLGADGWIEPRAAAVACAAGEGQRAVLARLGRDLETVVTIRSPQGEQDVTLYWSDGVVRADEPAAGGLARLWNAVDQQALIERMAAEGALLPMERLLGMPSPGWGMVGTDHPAAVAPSGLSLMNTASGMVWAEPAA